ncbi:uncharacterized protein RCO7_09949 [Rhynchosporium graminicola]|uniref:Uncharacterized protein n=1 Tax=Rhynchosporium graminicola TaxID=2792576 RepID=A0A1E1LL76_9HELO|nr:uncharacterized protein RCO7_09949 [Rhynchosporium commune]
MSKEKATYITYNAGVDAKHLHLGNLVHDFKNPSFYEPHIEKAYPDIQDSPPDWAELTQLGNYALTLGTGSEQGHAANNPSSKSTDQSGQERYRVAAAEKTTKISIKDPEEFFEEITLSSPSAKKWLASHLSAAESLSKGKSQSATKPEIWMLTGLILMQHATWTSLSSKDPGFIAGQKAPFDPSGVSNLRRLSISENVKPTIGFRASEGEEKKSVNGAIIHETGKYPGTRAWAAQWQKIEFQVGGNEKWKEGVKRLLKLKEGVAMVRVNEDVYAEDGEGKGNRVELNDAYWEAFIDATDD